MKKIRKKERKVREPAKCHLHMHFYFFFIRLSFLMLINIYSLLYIPFRIQIIMVTFIVNIHSNLYGGKYNNIVIFIFNYLFSDI